MTITIGCPPGPERTRALLEELVGGQRGVKLRAQVLRSKPNATLEDVEEAFQEACLKAASRCRGQTMGELYKWLHRATDSTFDDLRDRRKHEVLVDPTTGDFEDVDATLAPPDELLIKREERAEIDRLTVAILDRLPERERHVAVLHSHGFARKEIAGRLSLTPRVVKRSIEDLLAAGRAQLTKLVGYGCPDGHELVTRYAFGLAVGREAQRAQLHLMRCPRCGAMFLSRNGTRLRFQCVHLVFTRLVAAAGLEDRSPRSRPRPHSLRHSFAVNTLRDWYANDLDVQARLPLLTTHLGHVTPAQGPADRALAGRLGRAVRARHRRRASRSPPSSRSTTSCGPPSRHWPACSAARSRCTRTPTTRRWRC